MGGRGGATVSTLVCLGFGYAAQHYAALYGSRFARIVGTSRTAESAAALGSARYGGRSVELIAFDGRSSSALDAAIADANALLVSVAPGGTGDPVLAHLRDPVAAAPSLASIVYLSTIAVYGDHEGRWIDEATPLSPDLARAAARIEAEREWQALGMARRTPVAVIRIAGIYGPGASAIEAVRAGRARRIAKPGQVFNRIHVADLAQIIDLAIAHRASGAFNAADDEPTPPGDPIVFAADLIGAARPPEIPFEEAKATMSPLAASFYGECKRVRNDRIKSVLGVRLRYPTYRDGLRALAAAAGNPP